ncbi:hypothetical protein [Crateriforma conspicua]|uniref:Double zinc ribbon n=1 Tax=Crateriforma conspicua TaxID=2527996 RepID=A0A5C5Y1X6_9PLAN|nr:hypothetical protein [Crateriforma conspicua]TWT69214.1 hypothetical protein Pan14r_14990 [Crateriforma conspicua]
MPIRLKCSCGKVLSVKDEMAGKAVKCPACSKPIRVPKPKAAAAPAAPQAQSELDDLFSEEGFDRVVAAACPACGVEMKAGAVLCTKCGFNKQTGEYIEGHKVAGVDVDLGTLQLQMAEESMGRDRQTQDEMLKRSGMPWWMLLVVLFVVGSGATLAVLTVNAANREDDSLNFSPMKTFLALVAALFFILGGMAYLSIVINAFKKSAKDGLLTLFIPVLYMFVFAIQTRGENLKRFFLALIAFGLGGYLAYRADRYVPSKKKANDSGNTVVTQRSEDPWLPPIL